MTAGMGSGASSDRSLLEDALAALGALERAEGRLGRLLEQAESRLEAAESRLEALEALEPCG